ncbi:flavin reductase family protein [Gordonia westfalica]|uniref:NADH-FMN oxidoreductase RutF, flavin reductase (DIM6/NTAB) family n=3 Tax=Gordonia TaxID=2053 RepID=A0A1H2KWM7_9ACTN|nr:flavin reductase family protein [Gordonia westfalica]SDU73110.1 NADH-FMN oxidoreductase RutF, flavin reductase (DIM6/NTAB) family [Gordonia westfalica]
MTSVETVMESLPRFRTRPSSSIAPIPAADFAQSMRMLASGVVIVTSVVDDRPWGVTLSSLSSFSADPARIAFSIKQSTATAQSIAELGEFGVAVLSAESADLAARQAAPGQPKFLPDASVSGLGPLLGVPAIEGAIYNLECKSVLEVEVLDHVLVVADVLSATTHTRDESGLVFFNQTFGEFSPKGENS